MNKSITRLLALLLICATLLGLSACSAAETPAPTEGKKPIRIPEPVNYEKCTELGTPLADERVRQALAYAIDVDTIIEALFYESAEKSSDYSYDPEKAKELLAEAGWPSDYILDVVYYRDDPQLEDLLQVIGSYWEAVGVKAEFRKIDGDVMAQLWTPPDNPEGDAAVKWDLALDSVTVLTESEFYNRFASSAPNNSHSPAVDGLDEAIGQGNWDSVKEIMTENVSCIPLLYRDGFVCVSDHVTIAEVGFGNDQYAYDKDILNWTTDREDQTLYTDGGPGAFFLYPVTVPGQNLYQELVFDRLIDADCDLNPAGGRIAETYTVSDDGKTVEFTVREDLIWHDEEPLTAEDVKFTFELYMQCSDADPVLSGVLEKLDGAAALTDGEAEECTGIVIEENTVTFRFAESAEDALTVFSQWPILPKHKLENVKIAKLQNHKFWQNPIGSGPFKVAEVKPGQFCILERWDDYWQTGDGNIRFIHMTSSDEGSAILALRDLLDYGWGTSTDDASCIEEQENMDLTRVENMSMLCFFINQYPHESYHLAQEATEPTE